MEVEITNMISKTTSGVSGAGSSSADNSDSALIQNRMVDVSDIMGAALLLRGKEQGDAVPTEMVEAARRVEASINSTQFDAIVKHMATRPAFQASSTVVRAKSPESGRDGLTSDSSASSLVENAKYELLDIGLDGTDTASWEEVAENVVVEAKYAMNRLPEFLLLPLVIGWAFSGTFYSSRRHETVHNLCQRSQLFDGKNDATDLPVGTDLDQFRQRDMGFEFFPEVHSKAIEKVIDVIPVFMGVWALTSMFIVSFFRRFKPDARKVRLMASVLLDTLWGIMFHQILRPFFYMGTGLIAPDRECVRGYRKPPTGTLTAHVLRQKEGLHQSFACGDLIYSGHCCVGSCFLFAWFANMHWACPGNSLGARMYRFLGSVLFLSMYTVQAWGIVATRHHYTVDLTVAILAEIFIRGYIIPLVRSEYLVNRFAILYSRYENTIDHACFNKKLK